MDKNEMREIIKGVKDKMRVTKVTCTRSVKGRGGDVFVGFSAAWDSVAEEQGHLEDGETTASGMTLKEAKIAAHLLGLQVEVTAVEHAMAGSVVRPHHAGPAIKGVRHNYSKLMADLFQKEGNGE